MNKFPEYPDWLLSECLKESLTAHGFGNDEIASLSHDEKLALLSAWAQVIRETLPIVEDEDF